VNPLSTADPFWSFNREERFGVAVLFALLMQSDNLRRFADVARWSPPDLAHAEVAVEWTYLRDRWNQLPPETNRREAILELWNPPNRAELADLDPETFNGRFIVGNVSSGEYQSPGRWSVRLLDREIHDNEAFLAACRFKWAFNIKPDLVVQTPERQLLCVEAKFESREGSYPSIRDEVQIFRRRALPMQGQLDVQRYLVEHLLDFDGRFIFLAPRDAHTSADQSITWSDALQALDISGAPPWARAWLERMTGAAGSTLSTSPAMGCSRLGRVSPSTRARALRALRSLPRWRRQR
jgi:hypothetical protein